MRLGRTSSQAALIQRLWIKSIFARMLVERREERPVVDDDNGWIRLGELEQRFPVLEGESS